MPARAAPPALLLLLTAPLAADDKKAPAAPSAEVVKAWKKAGLHFAWYGREKDGPAFRETPAGLKGAQPTFRPGEYQKFERLPALPDPKVPFALDLSDTRVTDAG